MSARADELFARYVERLVEGDEELSVDELAGGDGELRAALARRIEALHAVEDALGGPRRTPVGTQIGPYRVLAHLGSGGMGEVYRARDLPAHLLQYGATVEEVVNLVAVGAVEAASLKRPE